MVLRQRNSFLLIILFSLSACANKNLRPYLDNFDAYQQRVYVIDHGIHTGLVIETREILPVLGLQTSLYKDYRFVEIGRGDAGFYQDEEEKLSTTLTALFLSTPAVLHLRGYNRLPYQRYPLSHTLEVRLSNLAMQKLIDAVAASFAMSAGKAVEVAKGRDERSRFFEANGTYHLFYTCNNWTAEMLQQADYPMSHRWAFFAGSVMSQIEAVQRRLGLACGKTGGYQCRDTPVPVARH